MSLYDELVDALSIAGWADTEETHGQVEALMPIIEAALDAERTARTAAEDERDDWKADTELWTQRYITAANQRDAAEAERDRHLADSTLAQNQRITWAARAEKAEFEAEELLQLQGRVKWSAENLRALNFALGWGTSGISMLAGTLEAAEARIAAALAVLDETAAYGQVWVDDIRAALTTPGGNPDE